MFTLAPKDPFRNGRAIVAEIVPSEFTEESLFLVHTDFGHTMKLTAGELRELYEIDKPMSFEAWKFEREVLRSMQVEPSIHRQDIDALISQLSGALYKIQSMAEELRIKSPLKGQILEQTKIARSLASKLNAEALS